MKKTRKALSVVLSLLVAIGSLPLVYTGTAAAGTIDDPTKAMAESKPFEQEDLFKLNIEHSNNDFFFYQTIDDEYFVVKQSLSLQQYKVALGSNRSLTVHGVKFYEGGSNIADSVDNAGVVEEPTITDNKTAEFKSNYYVSDSWVSTHENSSGLDCTGDVSLHASGYDLNGRHKNYTWDHNVIFKGNPAGVTGQINTGYYERITWDWVSDDSAASMDFRIQTTITVVDAREFVKAIAKANDALANPGDHSEGYISAIQATISAIPEDAKNLTGKYDQATLDGYANDINKIQEDAGNYTEYNFIYSLFSSMTNDNGTYSGESFAAFKAAIAQINADLPKDLSGKDQQIINDAVAALRNAHETILVNNATLTPGVTHTETIVDMTVSVGIEFNLIQVKDNQKFSLAQPWTISHDKSSARKFAVTLKTDDADTNAFISRLDPSSYGTQDFDNKALSQNGATVFTCWDELDANGAFKESSDFLNDDRTINADYDGFKKGNTYYLQSTPIFYGMTPEQTGATQYFYTQNFYVGWTGTFGIGGSSGSSAFKTTINITDARPLVDAYEHAGIIIADKNEEDCPYTAEYIAQLETAYNSVPRDMVRGLVYYNQDTVNTETEKLTSLLNNPQYKADYTEYDKAVEEAESIIAENNSESVYEPSAFQSYITGVGEVPVPERNLSSAEQGTIDASTNALIALKNTLEANRYADYTELNAAKDAAQAILDNPTAYAPETVEAVRNALDEANEIPDGMVVGADNVNQKAIDDAADALNSVINSAVVLDGDYTAYNQAKAEIDAIINGGNADENGNPIYSEEIFTNVTNYVAKIDSNLDKNLKADSQATIDDATEAMISAKTYLEINKYADYTAFEEAKAEIEKIVNSTAGTYTEETVQAAKDALDSANTVSPGMVVGKDNANQDIIDAATDTMNQVIANAKEKADYSGLDEAIKNAQDIVDAPEGTYTDKTVEEAQKALDAAEALDKDLEKNDENQAAIDKVIEDLTNAADNAKEKADYSGLDEASKNAQDIVDAPEGTYTEESVKAAQDALDAAEALDKDLEKNDENQAAIDKVIEDLTNAADNAKEKADYSGLDEAIKNAQDIVDAPEGTYTEESVKAAQDALDAAEALDKDLEKNDENQAAIDKVIEDLTNAADNAKEKADYSGLDEAIKNAQDIVDAPEGTYTEESVKAAQDALDAAEALDKDLEKNDENQAAIDKVIEDLTNAADNAKEKADYSGLDEAIKNAQDIVDAPEGTYTEESVKAAQDALDAAEALDKDLEKNDENQAAIDKVIEDLTNAANNAKEKADYTEFDKVVEDLENIVKNADDYTSETVKNAQDALDSVKDIDRDMPSTEQDALDEITNGLKDVVNSADKKADYSDYNDAKDAADKLVNDDGNGNPIYDEDAFNEYKEAVEKIDSELIKDLPESEQETVNDASQALKDLRTELDAAKGTENSVIDPETTVDEIINDVVNNSGYSADEIIFEFGDYLGNELAGEDFVGTGSTMKAILKSTGELLEYKLFIIMGDVNGDGEITNEDYEISTSVNLGDSTHDEAHSFFFTANDMDADGVIDVLDTFEIVRNMK